MPKPLNQEALRRSSTQNKSSGAGSVTNGELFTSELIADHQHIRIGTAKPYGQDPYAGDGVMLRRRFKQTQSLEERLSEEAKRLRDEAKSLPPGALREALLRKARQADTGSHMSEWLRSPELQPPK